MDEANCHAMRAVVRFADGQESATPWYEKGCPEIMDELILLIRPHANAVKVSWENKVVPRSPDCCRRSPDCCPV